MVNKRTRRQKILTKKKIDKKKREERQDCSRGL